MLITILATLALSNPRFPAEWEPQQSVWLSWPRYDNVRDMPVSSVSARLASQISQTEAVDVIVSNPRMMATAHSAIRRAGGKISRIRFHQLTNNEIWIRDFGPIFLKSNRGLTAATFRFNYWGYTTITSKQAKDEDQVDEVVARWLGLPTIKSDLISEGGNREFNGDGVMIAVEAVERQRNPDLSLSEIERELRRVFGVKVVVWIPQGAMEDDLTFNGPLPGGAYTCITTGGHVDNVARFVDAHTVLVAEVSEADAVKSEIQRESRRRLEEAAAAVRDARDAHGHPFRVIRMPAPDPIFRWVRPGDGVYDFISTLNYDSPFPKGKPVRVVAAGSYMNFLIANGQVLTSTFWKPGRPASTKRKDATALSILRSAFPGRRVVSIDAEAVNWGGGGIHCITQQQPR